MFVLKVSGCINLTELSCVFATGPKGDVGNTGGTGATGQMYTVESTPRPTLFPPCNGPRGEV